MFRPLIFSALLCAAPVLTAMPAQASPTLSKAEQKVCPNLRRCIDVLHRHDATEFDYAVLEAEFRRFGPKGRMALFNLLESDAGTADIARMISKLGPLTTAERARILPFWGGPKTARLIPLADAEFNWFTLLDHPDRVIAEEARSRVFPYFGVDKTSPSPRSQDFAPLLVALKNRPADDLSSYLTSIPPQTYRAELRDLLISAEADTVTQSYAALYRDAPAFAFNTLLAVLKEIETVDQARAIGTMLARRDADREDGFYAKFAVDMSGDPAFPVSARAAALDALLKIDGGMETDFRLDEIREPAFAFLLSQPNPEAPTYAPRLAKIAPETLPALTQHIVKTVSPKAQQLLPAIAGHPKEKEMLRQMAVSAHMSLAAAAQQRSAKLGLTIAPPTLTQCKFDPFDLADMREQMPFFEGGFIPGSWPQFHVPVSRKILRTAHPTPKGWLAGYDRGEFGGGLLYFDNKTGEATEISLRPRVTYDTYFPENVRAVLPDKPLKLGESTQSFWVVTGLSHMGESQTVVHRVRVQDDEFETQVMLRKAGAVDAFSLSDAGRLTLSDKNEGLISITAEGQVQLGCSSIGQP